MDSFTPQDSVHANVVELRGYLGPHDHRGNRIALLPRDDLAAMIAKLHPSRKPNGSTVQRWEEGTEPDIASMEIMSDLAETSFELFVLGAAYAKRKNERIMATSRPMPRLTPVPTAKAARKKGSAGR